MIAIRGTLSAEDLITDFMCEPADMDEWMSTAQTPHAGQGLGSHDPNELVGSSAGTGFFSRHSRAQKHAAGTASAGAPEDIPLRLESWESTVTIHRKFSCNLSAQPAGTALLLSFKHSVIRALS